jgi:hypothetical protein
LAWELTPLCAKYHIFDQKLAGAVLILRGGRRFQCKSAATREDRAIVPILRVIGQETQQTAKIVSSTHNKTGRIGSEEYATDTAVTRA